VAFGGFADVWEGFLGNQKVAIKTIRAFSASGRRLAESKQLRRLRREYQTWSSLSHPNILQCFGFSYGFSQSDALPSLISPWVSYGSVFPYLEQHPKADRLELLVGVAHGVSYLHERGIVHGDLRAGNILVLDSGVPCLSDFGLSRSLKVEDMSTTSELAGCLRWMSPELLVDHVIASSSSDVWAFGMTVLEIMSGNRPYHEFKKDAVVLGQIKDGLTPLRPQGSAAFSLITDQLWTLCELCWALQPNQRPSMEKVTSQIIACQSQRWDEWCS